MSESLQTPLMKQYSAIKAKYPGTILLFRVGDFYETFGEDAVVVSKVLGIVLTRRSNGAAADIELAGFPHHSLDTYLPKLVRAGKRVAVCDQLEDPKTAKGIVKRGVTELVTPGVTFNDKVLELNKPNYLAAVHFPNNRELGAAMIDVTTADFFCFSGDLKYVEKILHTFAPAELLVAKKDLRNFKALFGEKFYLTRQEDWIFQYDYAREKLLQLFKTNSLKGFGIESEALGTVAAGALIHYINENQQKNLGHLSRIYLFDNSDYVWLDRFTVRNLELVQPLHPEGKALVDIIDQTLTPMGARKLRRALLLPLKDPNQIQARLDGVETLIRETEAFRKIKELLRQMGDLERLASKVAARRLHPKEAWTLRNTLRLLRPLQTVLQEMHSPQLTRLAEQVEDPDQILSVLERYLADPHAEQGYVIREGVSEVLDELRGIKQNGNKLLLDMQQRELRRTGISSLKISYNKVFGYYLEVTHAHRDKVPADWIRKQTLTNAERYITEELKSYEDKILHAEERLNTIEQELYEQLIQTLQSFIYTIQRNAELVAEIDMLAGFAATALLRQYVKPEISLDGPIRIEGGRHPVIESNLPSDSPYIPNDVLLDDEENQILIITGPNMAGKSALLRQTALIALMAQVGSFVPASKAVLGIVDKIFTRVGASDNIAGGESTFMVEMNETAQIVNNVSSRSLVLLDEIGRGTSTYDGISIAWALTEYLHENPGGRAKTMFATHYHELNELANRFPRVKNFNVSVKEMDGKVLFLRKLKPGGTESSFGIHVAEMAGMPPSLIQRARELLSHFEATRVGDQKTVKSLKFSGKQSFQLNMFELKDTDTLKIRQILSGVDIDRMTPVEALLKLQEIKRALSDGLWVMSDGL